MLNDVTLKIEADGLHISLTPEGKEWLEIQAEREDPDGEIFWGRPYEDIWVELLESYACNGGPELLNSHTEDYVKLGALTSAPIIAYDVVRNEDYKLVTVGRVFWFPQYAVESELEILLRDGTVIFEEAG